MKKYLVSIGDLNLGFEFIGPFDSEDDAQAWTDRHIATKTSDYDVFVLCDPDKSAHLIDR